MAGQEGVEPPTSGFGDRRSTNWSYWPAIIRLLNFSFLMDYMLTAKLAIFFELDLVRRLLLVLSGGVISSLTLSTSKRN